jgi:hypothetical protein
MAAQSSIPAKDSAVLTLKTWMVQPRLQPNMKRTALSLSGVEAGRWVTKKKRRKSRPRRGYAY